jgi:hypothetical protein
LRGALAAGNDLGALLDSVGDVASTFSTAFMSITAPGSKPSATFIAPAVSRGAW